MEVKYCGNCTLPPEYCRYNPIKKQWKNCLEWLKENEPQLLEKLAENDPVIAKDMLKIVKEEKKQNDNSNNKSKNKNKKNKNNENDENKLTTSKIVEELENKVNEQKEISDNLMKDIESSLSQLTTSPQQKPLQGILKNSSDNENIKNTPPKSVSFSPELNNDSDEYDDDGNKIPTNFNSNKAPPKKTKKKRRRGKKNKNKNKKNDNEDDEDEGDDALPTNDNHTRTTIPLPPQPKVVVKKVNKRDKKNNKKVIEVLVENRKGNKKATVVRGLMELGMKAKTAQSAFRKKFATGVGVQQSKSFNGKELVLQGDLRYDLMKFLKSEYKVPSKLLFYRNKGGLVPAVSPEGFVMPP